MTTPTAKPEPRRRAAPRLIPRPVFYLCIWLAILGTWLPKPWASLAAAPAILVGLAFFVQKWRRAGYDMTVGATQELEPR